MRLRGTWCVVAVVSGAVMSLGSAASAAGTPLPVAGVTASADDGNVPANAVDGDLGTRWSAAGDGAWIRYDLGTSQTLGSVSIAWHKGDTRRDTFDVQVSEDGAAWTTVLDRKVSSGSTLALQDFDFSDR